MAEQTAGMTVYVPVISDRRDEDDYAATACGAFRNKKDALHALIRELIDSGRILSEISFDYDENSCYEGVELKEDDKEYNILELCKLANTVEDVIDMCEALGDSYYDDGWKIEVNEFQLK